LERKVRPVDLSNSPSLKRVRPLAINVILDTGSTDLWFVASSPSLDLRCVNRAFRLNPYDGVGWFEDTGVSHEIRYGEGATFINGTIGLADMSIAGHDIHHQGKSHCPSAND
jgi:hypothetical protein